MHLPDHYLDPTTCLVTGAVSTAAVAWSLYRIRKEPRQAVLSMPAVVAGIFAAQMVNFPIAAGTSGHLLGGALAGILLGPWAGMLAMAIVVSAQAIVFGDGGIAALGANILNMAVLAAPFGAGINRFLQDEQGESRYLTSAAVAGGATVLAAALACSVEMVAAGTFTASEAIPAMLAVHSWIALAEAGLTAAFVAVLFAPRTNVLSPQTSQLQVSVRRVIVALTLVAFIAITISPFASNLPDGLESVVETLAPRQSDNAEPLVPPMLDDYALPGVAHAYLATALAGLFGVLVVATASAPLMLLRKRPVL